MNMKLYEETLLQALKEAEADVEAGRVHDAERAFIELRKKLFWKLNEKV